jgi:hypothetical protein
MLSRLSKFSCTPLYPTLMDKISNLCSEKHKQSSMIDHFHLHNHLAKGLDALVI